MQKTATAFTFCADALTDTDDGDIEELDLPPANTLRWDTKRKAQVVAAVCSGQLSLDQACDTYAMSVDEFLSWQTLLEQYGATGLMATRVKEYRSKRMTGHPPLFQPASLSAQKNPSQNG